MGEFLSFETDAITITVVINSHKSITFYFGLIPIGKV